MVPCNYLHNEIAQKEEAFGGECITDPEQQFEYLSTSISLLVLHNNERLQNDKFDTGYLIKESMITQQ